MKARLPVRLFVSYAAVAGVGAIVAYAAVRLLAPRLFDQRVGMMNGAGRGMGMGNTTAASVHSAFLSALNTALIVGVLASLAAAGVVAAVVTGRLLRPLDAVRSATRSIAAGQYDGRIALPSEPELAALAGDVNTLAAALAATESRRTQLLGEVAHEMRTPLTTLDGYVEGLIDGVFSPSPDTLASLSESCAGCIASPTICPACPARRSNGCSCTRWTRTWPIWPAARHRGYRPSSRTPRSR